MQQQAWFHQSKLKYYKHITPIGINLNTFTQPIDIRLQLFADDAPNRKEDSVLIY